MCVCMSVGEGGVCLRACGLVCLYSEARSHTAIDKQTSKERDRVMFKTHRSLARCLALFFLLLSFHVEELDLEQVVGQALFVCRQSMEKGVSDGSGRECGCLGWKGRACEASSPLYLVRTICTCRSFSAVTTSTTRPMLTSSACLCVSYVCWCERGKEGGIRTNVSSILGRKSTHKKMRGVDAPRHRTIDERRERPIPSPSRAKPRKKHAPQPRRRPSPPYPAQRTRPLLKRAAPPRGGRPVCFVLSLIHI